MIRTVSIISGASWGTDAIDTVNPETNEPIKGVQINLFDEDSNHIWQVPFTGEPLAKLVQELVKGLTDDQRREIAPTFNGGVILPGLPGNGVPR